MDKCLYKEKKNQFLFYENQFVYLGKDHEEFLHPYEIPFFDEKGIQFFLTKYTLNLIVYFSAIMLLY